VLGHLVTSTDTFDPVRDMVFSTRPFDRGLLYTANAAGTALIAFVLLSWIAERCSTTIGIRMLLVAGRTTLSLYLLHVFVFRLVVDVGGFVRPTGLDTALVFAASFWVFAVVLAYAWNAILGQGPAERIYRRFGD
jgi:uncharacterized membrane protein YeiB